MAFVVNCFDLLIKNGTVLDPGNGTNKKMDVGIYGSKIAEVFKSGTLPGKVCARKVIDAEGKYVLPGLVDGHGHVLPGLWFSYPMEELYKRGITAIIDMGSQSATTFNRVRGFIDEAPVVVNAALCLSGKAEVMSDVPLYTDFDQEIDKEKIKNIFEVHGDVLVGIKVYIGHNDSPGAELTRKVIKKAREICDYVGCRMVVHVSNPDIPFAELISYFKAGDNFTHTYNKGNILDENGNVFPEAWEAKKRGVLFDSARGARNWSAEVAQKAFAQGFFPDVITDDLTCLSNDPGTSRLTVHISECIAFGMKLEDALYAATNMPASYMKGVTVGIQRGFNANITIVDIEQDKPHHFVDSFGVGYDGKSFIVPRATIVKGKVMYSEITTDY